MLATVFDPRRIPMVPVRTNSLTPYCRSSFSMASIFSVSPMTWRITDFAPTSTIWARKMEAICIISAREVPWFCRDLYEGEFTLHPFVFRKVRDLDDIDELVELLHHLLDLFVITDNDNRDPAHAGFLARADSEALNIKSTSREEPGYP